MPLLIYGFMLGYSAVASKDAEQGRRSKEVRGSGVIRTFLLSSIILIRSAADMLLIPVHEQKDTLEAGV